MPEDEFDAFIDDKKAKGQQVTASEVYRKFASEIRKQLRDVLH